MFRHQGRAGGLAGSRIAEREAPSFLGLAEVPLAIVMTAQRYEVVALAGGGKPEVKVAERNAGFVRETDQHRIGQGIDRNDAAWSSIHLASGRFHDCGLPFCAPVRCW